MASGESGSRAALLPGRRGQRKNSLLLTEILAGLCGSNDQIAPFEDNFRFLKDVLSDWETTAARLGRLNLAEKMIRFTTYADDVNDILKKGREHRELSCFMKYKLRNEIKEIAKEMHEIIQKWSRISESDSPRDCPYDVLKETANFYLPLCLERCRCLYYFGLFPKGYEISARRLIALWVAEGLVQQRNGDKTSPESIAKIYLREFIRENMIEVVKEKPCGGVQMCRMLDDHRDSLVAEAENANFFYSYGQRTNSNSSSGPFNILRLVDHRSGDVVSYSNVRRNRRAGSSNLRSYYKYLSTFMSFDYREGDVPGEEIGNFLRKGISRGCFKGMRVVDLEGVIRPKLPESIGQLIHLRYLGLRRTYLEMLPVSAIENLLNLETLDLKHTYISELPNLRKLGQLRHLYLNESYLIRFVSISGVSSLKCLRTLCGVFIDDQDAISSPWQLSSLTKLGLAFRLKLPEQTELAAKISQQKDLESLRLMSIDESIQPSSVYLLDRLSALEKLSSLYLLGNIHEDIHEDTFTVNKLPQNLTYLTLSHSKLNKDPMRVLGNLRNLRILRLLGDTYTKEVMICCSGSFPKLEVLKLWKQERLNDLRIEKNCLEVLGEVEIRSCKNFKTIPDGFKHLEKLRELKLNDMPKELTATVNQWRQVVRFEIKVDEAEGNKFFSSGRELDPILHPF